uniref:Ig-like domain-containing protein n=1 Tax=Mastacembelus armatus TaxID=205130 RepID=A0A3Q3LKZ8_9TELE
LLQDRYVTTTLPIMRLVDSGAESVQLPCRALVNLLQVSTVKWTNKDNRKVHVYQDGSDKPEEQHEFYRTRTEMKKILLKIGNFSLTLKHPTGRDTNTYTCRVYNRKGGDPMEKQVDALRDTLRSKLTVPVFSPGSKGEILLDPVQSALSGFKKLHVWIEERSQSPVAVCPAHVVSVVLSVPQVEVEVESGAESVQLPFITTADPPGDVTVEWKDKDNRKVHVYQDDGLKQFNQLFLNLSMKIKWGATISLPITITHCHTKLFLVYMLS